MIQKVFSIYDSKARVFFSPFVTPNTDVAKRYFQRGVNDPASDICAFPGDYTLHELGTFDTETGHLKILDSMIHHGPGTLYKGNE